MEKGKEKIRLDSLGWYNLKKR